MARRAAAGWRFFSARNRGRCSLWATSHTSPYTKCWLSLLKMALFSAYFTHGQSPADHAVLLRAAESAGLNVERARQALDSGMFADEVREREAFYQQHGIHSVPAVIINDRHLIQGGQPVEVFEQALRQVAADA